jgi:glycine oxidase
MMLYYAPELELEKMLLLNGHYLIPRKDGHILVGSTLEYVGFNKNTTAEVREYLGEFAVNLLPGLSGLPVKRHWAGLRPGSPDGVPMIGPLSEKENLWCCAGHFRNGLVLAPASAELVVSMMLHRETVLDPTPYRI